jgi:hypothetical protein
VSIRSDARFATVAAAAAVVAALLAAGVGGSGLALYRTTGMTLGRETLTSLLAVPSASTLILLYVVLVPASLVTVAAALWRRAPVLRWAATLLVVAALLHLFGSVAAMGALALPLLPLLAVKGSPTTP